MAQVFGAWWACLLLAGVWSLACGVWLRRAWTAQADEANAAQLAASRNEQARLQVALDTSRQRIQALESAVTDSAALADSAESADLAHRAASNEEIEATRAAERQAMSQKMASFEAKAAGFDMARVTWLKATAERDQVIAELKQRIEALQNAQAQESEAPVESEPASGVAAALTSAAVAAPRRQDDLKRIEGIGPKIERLLNDAGYLSFNDLAAADSKALADVLAQAGPKFALARTDTWAEQAQLLADGNLEAFKKLTEALKGGVRR